MESKSEKVAVGDLVVGGFGWRTHTIVHENKKDSGMEGFMKLDPAVHKSPSTAVGVLGMPGSVGTRTLL